ncbi:MAG: aminoacyl-tRNA hydrolase [Planctomycetota bacterium]
MKSSLPDRSRPCVIAGLGNPGDSYSGTVHNAGFEVIDRLVRKLDCESGEQPDLRFWQTRWKGRPVHFLQPQTFMNLSGPPVKGYLRKWNAEIGDLLVVVDDLDLAPGVLRIRSGGSSGGHRGLQDLIDHLGSDRFCRCRVGVGRPPEGEAVEDFVLKPPPEDQKPLFEASLDRAAESALCWAVQGAKNAALRYNGPLPDLSE